MPLFDSRWPASTLKLMVRLDAKEAMGKDLADWGVDALAVGLDSPALRTLAGMAADPTPSRFEAEPLFRVAAHELGMPVFTQEDILLAFMDECAQAIADGADNLQQWLQTIHVTVIDPLNHREDLMPWCHARRGFKIDGVEELSEDDVRDLARKWLLDRAH